MKHNVKRYGFRWRMFYKTERNGRLMWSEPFRVPFGQTILMLDMVFTRLFHGPKGRWLYVVLPGIVDVREHNWDEPGR
jgi:hypothetical protein